MSGNVQRISVGVTLNGQKYTLFCFSSYSSKQNKDYNISRKQLCVPELSSTNF